ncbi:thialysine N-epsilon-acetyltransferase-like [Haemaphysalis longicornis]
MSHPTIAVNVRKATEDDCEALQRLLKGAQEFDFTDGPRALADLKENAFGEWPLVTILVAEDGSKAQPVCDHVRPQVRSSALAGLLPPCPKLCSSLLPGPPLVGCAVYSLVFSTWAGRSMVLDGVHVAPAYRGKGVGSALLRAVFKEASEHKCNEVTCQTSPKNEGLLSLLRRHGAMDQERIKGWHLFDMDERAITLCNNEQPWSVLGSPGVTYKQQNEGAKAPDPGKP